MGVIVIAALVCAVLYLCYLCFWRSNSSSDLTGEQNTLPDLTGEQNTLPDLTAEQRIANEPQISFAQRRENAFRKRRKAKASTPAKKNDSPALKTPFAQRRENAFRKQRKAKASTPAKKNDSPALKTPSAWKQRRDHAFAAFSAKRPSASSWRPPRVPLKQDDRNMDRDLLDGSWVPYTKGPFNNKNIFMFNERLTMHNSMNCCPDTCVRALMMKNRSCWGYNSFTELKSRTRKLRVHTGCPTSGSIVWPADNLRKLFFRNKIGLAVVTSTRGRNDDPKLKIYVPNHVEKSVTHYYLSSVRRPGGNGINYADALSKRIGKDDFKVLWTNDEMAALYDECYPWNATDINGNERRTRQLVRKEILMGKTSPAMKANVIANLGK